MLLFLVIYFSVVAFLGLFLLIKLLSGNPSKLIVGIVHGSLGLLGLGLLIMYVSFQKGDTPYLSILFFFIAFMFGGGMFVTTIRGKKFPKIILFVHIALALSGLYFLFAFWLK